MEERRASVRREVDRITLLIREQQAELERMEDKAVDQYGSLATTPPSVMRKIKFLEQGITQLKSQRFYQRGGYPNNNRSWTERRKTHVNG